jgi:hypothetical protein
MVMTSVALTMLALAVPVLAGPPFVCHPFDIGAAKSLPWGAPNNFLAMRDDYDVRNLVADTDALLKPSTPAIVRMETLRRAVMYAARDRALADQLFALVMNRAKAAKESRTPDAMAFFDAGFVAESLTEIADAAPYMKAFSGLDRVLAGVTRGVSGRALIEAGATIRPDDESIKLALSLLGPKPLLP